MSKHSFFLALASAALFGAATPASKLLLHVFSPFQLAGLLYLGAALGVIPIVMRERAFRPPWRMDRTNRWRLFGAISFGGILGPALLLFGLRLAPSASVSMWLNLELVATALLGTLIFKDHLSRYGWIGVIGALLAAVLLSSGEGVAGIRAGMLVALACLCWGMDNHLTALIDGITPAQSTLWKGMVAGAVNLAIGVMSEGYAATVIHTTFAAAVGALSYGASIVLYITAAQKLGATRSQIIFSSAPFFGILLSVVLLGEILSGIQILAALILAASVAMLAVEKHSHQHHHEANAHIHRHQHDDDHHDHLHQEQSRSFSHTHRHKHEQATHSHPHWPDLHHRHMHGRTD